MASVPIKPEVGMVAFLDILGYTNFLQNNEPEEAAGTVLEYLLGAPKKANEQYESLFNENENSVKDTLKQHVAHFKWLIFSDTILITNSYEHGDSEEQKRLRWKVFLATLILLYRNLFENGLPIRGGVGYGKFFVKDNCFVGRPIIAAYQLAHRLDLAAIAMDPSAIQEMSTLGLFAKSDVWEAISVEYLAPTKQQASEKMRLLQVSFAALPRLRIPHIRQAVAESFWKHKKDLPPEVVEKLNNTELFFRFAKMANPKLFSD